MDAAEPSTVATLAGYARARSELSELLADVTPDQLRRRSIGTRWTNEQLLFHLVFGYMVTQAPVRARLRGTAERPPPGCSGPWRSPTGGTGN